MFRNLPGNMLLWPCPGMGVMNYLPDITFTLICNDLQIQSYSFFVNKAVWGNVNRLIPQAIRGKTFTYFLSQNRNYLGAHLCIWPKEERKKLILSEWHLQIYRTHPRIFKEKFYQTKIKMIFLSNHLIPGYGNIYG